jgi:glucose-1-phosphate cytidylyltransferase
MAQSRVTVARPARQAARGGVQTVIFCGGRGTRLREYTEALPKVLVEVGGRPILWHIMKGYAHNGFDDFVLALGYLSDRVKEYFLDYHGWRGRDLRLELGTGKAPEMVGNGEAWSIVFADTGADTNTGGRLKRVEPYLRPGAFFVTYGDGVSDIDHQRLLDFHRSHGKIATVTVVRPRLTFGVLDLQADGRVAHFAEKPQMNSWINGGFFVFDHRIFEYLEDNPVLERDPMQKLAADGQLMAYRHEGYWACMDTYKDNVDLNAAWAEGRAPWRTWDGT